ncbi:MAG: hypothetical protein HZB26_22175 [Candidatus Hydrogenedentes bacterium]|nr:hypothetical protein [Candidatus Hydrogenedentota bacterium]
MKPIILGLLALFAVLASSADSLHDAILQAGNAATDEQRLAMLKDLRARESLSAANAAELDRVIAQVDQYITDPKLAYFDRAVRDGALYAFGIRPDSPFRPIELLYQARMHVWFTLENGGYWSVPETRRARLDEVRALFEKAAAALPGNRRVAMYLGKPVPPEKSFRVPSNAPEWAVHQREGLERLTDIIGWWIDHRMKPDGQYGGGWGDDCEMWRWWVPVLIGFDDPKIADAQSRFSRALMNQLHMKDGYTTQLYDVEHTAEDSADAITPMMHLEPGAPEWRDRALRLAELMEQLWTGRNDKGQVQFKSTYFSVNKVDLAPKRACDTVYHARAVQPALLYWQRTGDKRLAKLFTAWMDTWVDATSRAERGKPAGVIPSAIHWPDGVVGGIGEHWWDPENHNADPLYVWPSAMGCLTNTLLLAYHMTGDEKYLDPLRSMAAIRLAYLLSPPTDQPEPGSREWCAGKMKGLADALAKYRLLTGSTEFDSLFARDPAPYLRFRLNGDMAGLTQALRKNADALRINFPGYTSEVRYTDRVLRFPSLFQKNGMFPEPVPGIAEPEPALLYSTVTGDPGDAGYFPLNAVRWLTPPRAIAALVTESSRTRFEARLFHFDSKPRPMNAELYLLSPGAYSLTLGRMGSERSEYQKTVNVTGSPTRIRFVLPPQRECLLRLVPRSK